MNTNYIRQTDDFNRIVLPRTICQEMGIRHGSSLLIQYEDGKIIIEHEKPLCKICGSTSDVHEEMPICNECLSKAQGLSVK